MVASPDHLEGALISIVDDDPSVVRALSRLCRSAGYAVHAFESAEAFLEADAGRDSDCLILDVHLPGLSGPELQLRLIEEHCGVPIVFITAFEDEATRGRALESGARAFLQKPLDTEVLLEAIQEALSQN